MNRLTLLFVVIGLTSSNYVAADSDRISELKEEIRLLEKLVELKRELAALEQVSPAAIQTQPPIELQASEPQGQLDLTVAAQEIDIPEDKPKSAEGDKPRAGGYSAQRKRTGLYAGGNIGLGFVDFDLSTTNSSTSSTTTADLALLGGATYGLQVGYSAFASNGLFYAVEADYSKSNIDANFNVTGGSSDGDKTEIKLDNWWATSVRLGKSIDNSQLVGYVKGGYAKGDFTVKYTDANNSSNNIDAEDKQSGWLYGVGFEHPVAKNLLLRGEYLVLNLDDWTDSAGNVSATLDPDAHVAQVGLAYAFD